MANHEHIDKYIRVESEHGALMGPFQSSPFEGWFRTNPLMTRPKRDSVDMCVILDLSYPRDSSVNAGIPSNSLDSAPFKLRLPTPQMLADQIRSLGRGCLLYKVDLSRAYRQLRSDPLNWPLLGVHWEGQDYIDVAIPFGLRHGASACQRTTEAMAQITHHRSGANPLPYVDGSGAAAAPAVANDHYQSLLDTMSELGLEAALGKCQAPSTFMSWIGVHFDTLLMLMSIDPERVAEAVALCRDFLAATYTHRHSMQSFLGKVFHATRCTEQARRFTGHLFDLLRATSNDRMTLITPEARLEARWLCAFLPCFNGKTLIKPTVAQVIVHVDSCLQGGGGFAKDYGYYHVAYPLAISHCHFGISSLECFNVLIALRLWAPVWQSMTVLLYTDNAATVAAANSGSAQDPLIRSSIRELWWICAIFDVELVVRH